MGGSNKKCIIDSSVAIKWLLNEEDSEIAMHLRNLYKHDLIDIIVPSHFYWEICNVMARKASAGALRFFSELRMSDILEVRLTNRNALMACKLMEKYPKISFYDASYHALAILEKGIFVTADQKYYETMREEGSIILLKNYSFN
ncbi:MAG: type II toxin-antitoxin system VapC family toxin [Candidatus Peregrinibacteria bacterium]|nr:type II toxin-antitoxin system VapC family toxin [Candidatus Peregrinibacteria bacterium]MDZ4244634.1 type II toxin-antitoxin system VapC family toxin [Candidatus Gracilibacteria bacterium]